MSSSISCGIVGLPNVGKSTLFNTLTKGNALVANYPFATIDPNVGIVDVPDERLNKLAELYNCNKIIPSTVSFTDIAGLVAGASKGEGLGNQFLSHIRSCEAIIQVVRAFDDGNITHVDENHNPQKDIDTINTELVLADLQTVNKRLPIIEKESRLNPKVKPIYEVTIKAHEYLDDGKPLWNYPEEDWDLIKDLNLITAKKIIYVFNMDENDLGDEEKKNTLKGLVSPANSIFVCAKLENELKDLDDEDKKELLESYGQKISGLEQLIHEAYSILGLQSYLTAGEKEVRSWTIKQNSTAPQAAGVIHTDFERGFIAAEIVDYKDLIELGSLVQARGAGKVRTEGKTYIVKPDDVVEFRFNV